MQPLKHYKKENPCSDLTQSPKLNFLFIYFLYLNEYLKTIIITYEKNKGKVGKLISG